MCHSSVTSTRIRPFDCFSTSFTKFCDNRPPAGFSMRSTTASEELLPPALSPAAAAPPPVAPHPTSGATITTTATPHSTDIRRRPAVLIGGPFLLACMAPSLPRIIADKEDIRNPRPGSNQSAPADRAHHFGAHP